MASICCLAKSRFANSLLASAAESASCSLSRSNNFQICKPLGAHFLSNSPCKNEHFTKRWKESYTFLVPQFLMLLSATIQTFTQFGNWLLFFGRQWLRNFVEVCLFRPVEVHCFWPSFPTCRIKMKLSCTACFKLFYIPNQFICVHMVLNDAAKCLPQSDRHSPQRSAEGPSCLVLLFLSLAHVQIAASCKQKPNVMNAETNPWLVCRPGIRLATIACGHPC